MFMEHTQLQYSSEYWSGSWTLIKFLWNTALWGVNECLIGRSHRHKDVKFPNLTKRHLKFLEGSVQWRKWVSEGPRSRSIWWTFIEELAAVGWIMGRERPYILHCNGSVANGFLDWTRWIFMHMNQSDGQSEAFHNDGAWSVSTPNTIKLTTSAIIISGVNFFQ